MRIQKLLVLCGLCLLIVGMTYGCSIPVTATSDSEDKEISAPVVVVDNIDAADTVDGEASLPINDNADLSEELVGEPELEDPGNAAVGFPDPLDLFEDQLKRAVSRRDYDELALLMTDSFGFGLWMSEGWSNTSKQAIEEIHRSYLMDGSAVQFQEQPDVSSLFPEGNVLTVWNPEVNPVRAVYSSGWGADGAGEAFLIIVDSGDGEFAWGGMLYAPVGFIGY